MKLRSLILAVLAAVSVLQVQLPLYAADTIDDAVRKMVQGTNNTNQPQLPPVSIFAHSLLDNTNTIRMNTWGSSIYLYPDATHVLTLPLATGTLAVSGTTSTWTFEGATADAYETTLSVVDPTADGTFYFPNLGAGDADTNVSVMVSTINSGLNAPGLADAVWGGASSFVFEGATADAYETTLAATDPTADATLSLPARNASATIETVAVAAHAATASVAAGELYGGVLTNTGASGAIVLTLPAPAVGMHFRVYLTVAQDVDINPADGTQILTLTNATGDAISSAATIGNSIELVALSTTTWAVFASSGVWTDVN